jgi:hypothetical protein
MASIGVPPPLNFLTVLPEFGVLVCIECRYVVNHQNLEDHLRGQHEPVAKVTGHNILSLTRFLSKQLHLEQLPDYTSPKPIPRLDQCPIPYLPVHTGFVCELYPYARTYADAIVQHYRTKHSVVRITRKTV